MKKLISLMVMAMAIAAGSAHAADDKAATGKKSKLATCSSEAKGLTGEEYKKKRNECMKAAAPAAAASATVASPTCEKSAADKKLHGAAKTAHIKKCMADAK